MNVLAVFIGGGIGSVLRYLILMIAKKIFLLPFVGTFIANMFGCLVIGWIFGLTLHKLDAMPQEVKLFITIGFLGGLTTFSTLNLEVFELLKTGKMFLGVIYMLFSCLIGLLLTFLGYFFYTKIFH